MTLRWLARKTEKHGSNKDTQSAQAQNDGPDDGNGGDQSAARQKGMHQLLEATGVHE